MDGTSISYFRFSIVTDAFLFELVQFRHPTYFVFNPVSNHSESKSVSKLKYKSKNER
jgi:hypothetical protein